MTESHLFTMMIDGQRRGIGGRQHLLPDRLSWHRSAALFALAVFGAPKKHIHGQPKAGQQNQHRTMNHGRVWSRNPRSGERVSRCMRTVKGREYSMPGPLAFGARRPLDWPP